MKNSIINRVDGRQAARVVNKAQKFFPPALALLAMAALVPAANAQFVRLKSSQIGVTVPVGSTGSTVVTNLVTFSGINSSGVSLSVVGLPPSAGALLNTGIATANNTALQITVNTTNVPEGSYPFSLIAVGTDTNGVTQSNSFIFTLQSCFIWNGGTNVAVSGAGSFSDPAQWLGGGAPGVSDSIVFNDLGGQSNSLIGGVLTPNIDINSSVTNASVRFAQTNSSTRFYTIQLSPGVTWAITGSNGFTVQRDFIDETAGISASQTDAIRGSNAALVISNEQAAIAFELDAQVAYTVDLSALDNFVTDVGEIGLGDYNLFPNFFNLEGNNFNGVPRRFIPSVNFARTNIVRAVLVDPFGFTNVNSRRYSLTFGNSEISGTTSKPNINLGISNLFLLDSICLDNANQETTLAFNPALHISTNVVGGVTNLVTNSMTAIFRGTNGGRMSMFCIADGGGSTNVENSNVKATIDFSGSGGTLDLLADQLIFARDRTLIASNNNPTYQGLLTMGNGIIDVNTAILGFREHAQTNTTPPTLPSPPSGGFSGICEGRVTILSNGVFRVNQLLTLGSTVETSSFGLGSGGNTEWGQIIVQNGGSLIANQINVGGPVFGASLNNLITISNNATMIISNTVASTNQSLDTLTFNNSTLVMNLDGNNPGPYIFTTNLTTVGNNTIRIASIKNLGSITGSIQLISYSAGAGAFQNLIMPSGLGGALITTNNAGIFLTILQGTPKDIVWRGFSSPNWDLSTANWLDLNTGLQTNYANGDNVSFDDNLSVPMDIHLAGGLDIIPGSVAMTNNSNGYIIDSQDGTAIKGSAVFTKQGTNAVEIDATTSLNVQLNQGTLIGNGAGTVGSVVVPNGITMNYNGNIVGGLTVAGVATINGTSGGNLVVQSTGIATNAGTFIGSFSLSSGALLVNNGVFGGSDLASWTAVGNPVVASRSTFINNGDFHSLTLTVNGTFQDMGTGQLFINGDVASGTRGLTIASGGLFIPGGNAIGTTAVVRDLTDTLVNGGRVLFSTGSTNIFKIDPSQPANTELLTLFMGWGPNESTPAINGGTIVISNTSGAPFVAGQSFTIASGSFGGDFGDLGQNTTNSFPIIEPADPGPGLAWDLSGIIHQGILAVRGVATTPINFQTASFFTNLVVTNSSGTPTGTNHALVSTFTWPTNYTGWELQQQGAALTNGLSLIGSNWTTIPGSSFVDSVTVTNILGTNGSAAFFRMIYP